MTIGSECSGIKTLQYHFGKGKQILNEQSNQNGLDNFI